MSSKTAIPKISIITPSFCAISTIEQTIRSVESQEYPNVEYIVIDGGSSDGTVDLINRYENVISYWHSGPDGGQYDAINKGFERSTGDVLCWLNADDMLMPRALWIVAEVFSSLGQVSWISSLKPSQWDASGYLMGHQSIPGFSREAFLDGLYLPGIRPKGYVIQQESTFWRRDLWKKAGGRIPDNFGLAGDFALWAEFYKHAELVGVDYPLSGFRMIAGQRSEDGVGYLAEAKRSLAAMRREYGWRDTAKSRIINSRVFRPVGRKSDYLKSLGYEASKIVKSEPKKMSSTWASIEYKFLP